MAVNRTGPKPLAFISAGMLLTSLIAGVATTAPNAKVWFLALREPVVLLPALPSPLPSLLLVALLALTGLAVARALAGDPPSRALSGAVFGLGLGLVFLRMAVGSMLPPAVSPFVARAEVGKRMQALAESIDADLRAGRPVPTEGSALTQRLEGGRTLWRSHGRRLAYQVVLERGLEARLQGRPGDLPGTIYCVLSSSGERFWITGLVLDGAPTGSLDFARNQEGHPTILSAARRANAGR